MTGQLELGGGNLGFSLILADARESVPADRGCPGRRVVHGACTVCGAPAADGRLGRHAPVVVQEALL